MTGQIIYTPENHQQKVLQRRYGMFLYEKEWNLMISTITLDHEDMVVLEHGHAL